MHAPSSLPAHPGSRSEDQRDGTNPEELPAAAEFQAIAQKVKRECPLSKALASVPEITLDATQLA